MLVYSLKKNYNNGMEKKFIFLLSLIFISANAVANDFMPKRFNAITSHEDVYPYRLNNANPNAQKINTSSNTMNTVSSVPMGKRNVVKRKTRARVATTNSDDYYSSDYTDSSRRIVSRNNSAVARSANVSLNPRISDGRDVQNVSTRSVHTRSITPSRAATNTSTQTRVSSQRCFSDYKECMEMYCLREDAAYNRCYCSAKLAQIDAKYKNKIDNLIQQIIKLQYGNPDVTSEEIKEYWDRTIGVYTNDNPWVNIDNALNIEWADSQSRMRGQQAFNTGHDYCVQHLRACSYMASNMRDAYKSEIARDCETYEKSLQRIQNAAESVIESYKK